MQAGQWSAAHAQVETTSKIHLGLCWLILQLFVKTTNQGVSHTCACLLLSEMASPDLSVPSPQPRT